jgi:hypothetical protein
VAIEYGVLLKKSWGVWELEKPNHKTKTHLKGSAELVIEPIHGSAMKAFHDATLNILLGPELISAMLVVSCVWE